MKTQPFQPTRLLHQLRQLDYQSPIEIICLDEVDSTQSFLKDYPDTPGWAICTAETQTQGRGRLGRKWSSEVRGQIYCSIRMELLPLHGLSLVVGLAVLAALKQACGTTSISLKWPNDLLWQGKKLAGILIEVSGNAVILGIGLNVSATTHTNACALADLYDQPLDRNLILAEIIVQLEAYLARFIQQGLGAFMAEWDQVDGLKGQPITVQQGARTIKGIALGINMKGELLLQDDAQQLHVLGSGETTFQQMSYSAAAESDSEPSFSC